MDDATKITLITRELEGKYLRDCLTEYFKAVHPNKTFVSQLIDKSHGAVQVSLESKSDDSKQFQIKTFPITERPNNLIHHPQEQQLSATQKIEQIIGVVARVKTGTKKSKQLCIFDGHHWSAMGEKDLSVDTSHTYTKNQMNFFKESDTYVIIIQKLLGIIEDAKKHKVKLGMEEKELSASIAFYLEGYLNNYDSELIFRRNFKDTLTVELNIPELKEDKEFKRTILSLLEIKEKYFKDFEVVIEEYKKTAPETFLKKNILGEYSYQSKQYRDNKLYEDLATKRKQEIARAVNRNAKAKLDFQAKKYKAANALFFDVLKILTFNCVKSDPSLATVYYNIGRVFQMLSQLEEAKSFLETALYLRAQIYSWNTT